MLLYSTTCPSPRPAYQQQQMPAMGGVYHTCVCVCVE